MRLIWSLAWRSAWHRRFGLSLVLVSVALSTFLLLGLERLRHDVRQNFALSVSGTDLIVGARSGSVQLMLYAVFRVGDATQNIAYSSVEALEADEAVAWVVPISLGDSHRGYPVVATSTAYFEHFRYGQNQALQLAQGQRFEGVFDVVLGAEVAARLGYSLGQTLTLNHGSGDIEELAHTDKPFRVVGILAPTATPVDRSLHISLQGMEAIHLDWVAGVPLPGRAVSAEQALQHDLRPKSVTAALVGLKSRAAVFRVQRRVADFKAEPLMAVLPGVALDELWSLMGVGERALKAMSALVGVVSLAGLVAVIATSLEQRRRELAVLRSIGARPSHIFSLLVLEGLLVTACGAVMGAVLCAVALLTLAPWLQAEWGLALSARRPSATEVQLLLSVVLAGGLASVWPGWRAYRWSLADGLSPKA
ncbi:ABC transporter permease [Ideonella sp.]|jgi:putative ABC transport system permease protein|uniref:ABC transporter permease n=1 Tax=Ideonella sp. TaxID=1929293 RepID=UPI0037BF2820